MRVAGQRAILDFTELISMETFQIFKKWFVAMGGHALGYSTFS